MTAATKPGRAPLGVRLNNPGNLERGPAWEGLSPDQPHERFAKFTEAKFGIRAIARTLISYFDKRKARDGSKIDTVREVIERWAPPSENDVDSYARHVASLLHAAPDEIINIKDPAIMRELVRGIIRHEQGFDPYPDAVIDAGLVLAGIEPERKPLSKSRTVVSQQVAAGSVTGLGVLEALKEPLEQAKGAVAELVPFVDQARWILFGLIVATIVVTLWARWDDRRKGLR